MSGSGRKSDAQRREFGQRAEAQPRAAEAGSRAAEAGSRAAEAVPLDARIAALADAQHGVISLPQLTALGLSERAAQRWAKAGRLHRVHQGIYAVGRSHLEARGCRLGAVLASGPGAALFRRTAGDALGVAPRASARIEIAVPTRSGRSRPGVDLHRVPDLLHEDVTTVDGIPCTTVARTLLDLAWIFDIPQMRWAIENSERLGLFDLRAVEAVLERTGPQRPRARFRAALIAYAGTSPPPTRRELERKAFELFAKAGLPRPLVNTLVETDDGPYEADFCWPERRLIVEADSWEFHGTRAAFERDRRRDQFLLRAAWRVIRVTWRQIGERPLEVVATLKQTS